MPPAPNFCIQCAKPVETRCAACKIVFYCSQECQRRDWKYHKRQCRQGLSVAGSRMVIAARGPRIFSATVDQVQLLNIGFGGKRSVYEQATAAGFDHQLIAGASGADSYESNDGRGHFWRLSAPVRERWEAKARAHNLKTFDFWRGYAEPVSRDAQWVDLALDVITKRKLPIDKESLWQEQASFPTSPNLLQRKTPPYLIYSTFVATTPSASRPAQGSYSHLGSQRQTSSTSSLPAV
ncbi:hypothetical protein B0H11DRAFT_1008481 [Mycena galericulata]|nr:hypothetical protein B0H11DRAFT_1008481 [Mycena galericulata]